MSRALIPLTAVLCLVLLGSAVTGCGASESEPDLVEETTTADADVTAHQEYIAEGDALCGEAQVEASELARRAQEVEAQRSTVSNEELIGLAADLWDDQIEVAERYRERLADLDAPDEDEPRVEAVLSSLDEGIAIARDIKASLDDGEEPPQTLFQSYGAAVSRGNMQAQAFGFQVCGRSG